MTERKTQIINDLMAEGSTRKAAEESARVAMLDGTSRLLKAAHAYRMTGVAPEKLAPILFKQTAEASSAHR